MIFSCILENEKTLLKNLIGKELKSIKSEEKDSWSRIFGNLSIVTEDQEIEIRNELTPTDYFGGIEDLSKFKILKIMQENPFKLMIESPIIETPVHEKIADILIIQDEISVTNLNGDSIYEITMDDAIVIKTESSSFAISREWSLEEELIFSKTVNYMDSIYSVKDIISEWSDKDSRTKASCKRREISLKSSA